MSKLGTEIKKQIDEITLDPGRPIIVSDADEVLFQFVGGLERYLETQGLWLDLQSFALSGNIKYKDTNEVYPTEKMRDLLSSFFAVSTSFLEPVEGAALALERLSEHAQIVVLSNVPLSQKQAREETLAKHGMHFPVIANEGLKGPAAAYLAAGAGGPFFFLDDIPHNITSVREAVPSSVIIHFIADPRLARLLGPAEHSDHRIDLWPEVHDVIHRRVVG